MLTTSKPTFPAPLLRQRALGWAETRLGPGLLRFAGASLVLAAVGLWITPGAGADPELALLKLGTSILFACLGLVFLDTGKSTGTDEFHIDDTLREVRHILRGPDGIARLQARYGFDDLSDVQVIDNMLLAHDHAGQIVLHRPVADLDIAQIVQQASRCGLIRQV